MEKEIVEKIQAQEEYCTKGNVEMFCPSDGICFSCKFQIFSKISLEEAKTKLITGCPKCNYSFVE